MLYFCFYLELYIDFKLFSVIMQISGPPAILLYVDWNDLPKVTYITYLLLVGQS